MFANDTHNLSIALCSFILSGFVCHAVAETVLSTPECETLKALLEQAPKDFALLRGAPQGLDKWRVYQNLPGSRECFIQKTKRIMYVCYSEILPSGVVPQFARNERADAIHACLGPAWTKLTEFSEFFISINDAESTRSVTVTVESDPFGYYLSTTLARMNQLPLEPPPQTVEQLQPHGYCDALKVAVADSRQKFSQAIKDVERNISLNSFHWRSNNQLPGWNECFVHEWNDNENCRSLACRLGNVAEEKQSRLLMDKISLDMRSCLGPTWRENKTRRTDGVAGTRLVSRDNPVIELQPSKSFYSDAWGLDLSIWTEAACPAIAR